MSGVKGKSGRKAESKSGEVRSARVTFRMLPDEVRRLVDHAADKGLDPGTAARVAVLEWCARADRAAKT